MSGPLPDILRPITVPISWAYQQAIELRNRRYDRGDGVKRLDVPVISVGNITTGGTGKTPIVLFLAQLLQERGVHPAIAMRGYGGNAAHPADESLEYARALPDVPLIVSPDRTAACGAHLQDHPHTACILLDDGFQHRQLHRDLDLVLIDAQADTFSQRMLPAGHLREPLDNLSRADAVIVTRTAREHRDALSCQIERWHGKPPLAWTEHRWRELLMITSGGEYTVSLEWLREKRVVTLLGVGNPRAILAQLEKAGANIAADIPACDHERFTAAKLRVAHGLCDGLHGLVMTMKDWMRAKDVINLAEWRTPIVIPMMDIEFLSGREALVQLILHVAEVDRGG